MTSSLGALAFLAIALVQTQPEFPPPMACSLELAPEGFSEEVYTYAIELAANEKASIEETEATLNDLVSKCYILEDASQFESDFAFMAIMSPHLQLVAENQLSILGYDVEQIDAVIVPSLAEMDLSEVSSGNLTSLTKLRPMVEQIVETAVVQTGVERAEIEKLIGLYLLGLTSAAVINQVD